MTIKIGPLIFEPIFRWYDIWVGVFVDTPKQRLYIFPLPMLGVKVWRYYGMCVEMDGNYANRSGFWCDPCTENAERSYQEA